MSYLFVAYPKCSTCQKARKWLDENRVDYQERHIVEQNPTEGELREWISRSGLPVNKFFNTSGMLYRQLGLKDKISNMSEAQKIEVLASDGMLVKRPLLISNGRVLVGFKPEQWEQVKG